MLRDEQVNHYNYYDFARNCLVLNIHDNGQITSWKNILQALSIVFINMYSTQLRLVPCLYFIVGNDNVVTSIKIETAKILLATFLIHMGGGGVILRPLGTTTTTGLLYLPRVIVRMENLVE
jgi:hypothetical protein